MGIVEVLTDLGGGLASMFVQVFNTVATIFFTVEETGVEVTPLGYIALIGLALSIVWGAFRLVKSLIARRG